MTYLSALKLLLIAGARPNFVKIAPLIHELDRSRKGVEWQLVHTGQHYDYEMSKVFFQDLDIPEPHFFLNAGSGSHAEQTAKIMVKFEKVCLQERPDIIAVVGDVNSTLACSVTAKKLGIKVAHVEAGLRSGDMTMPEEVNRIVTDAISDYLFVSERSGVENLKREGKEIGKIYFTGNVMIDTLYYCLEKLKAKKPKRHHDGRYAVLTLHRPANVDEKGKLKDIIGALRKISKDMEIYFPVHPRTRKNLARFGFRDMLNDSHIKLLPPLSYIDFLALWKDASLVLTDSGGIQEETTVLGIPCFTIRDNTERPITVEEGTNVLVGTTRKGILKAYGELRKGNEKKGKVPELWDGKTAERIINILHKKMN